MSAPRNRSERALVVFESMFGNTADIARAVAEGIRPSMTVDVVEVSDAPDVVSDETTLLVVGVPTHAFSLSRKNTRESARGQATEPLVSQGRGVREWLNVVKVEGHVNSAAFDTRVRKPRVPGSAARKAHRMMHKAGFDLVGPAMTFDVGGTKGPVLEGEVERARRWGEELVAIRAVAEQRG